MKSLMGRDPPHVVGRIAVAKEYRGKEMGGQDSEGRYSARHVCVFYNTLLL